MNKVIQLRRLDRTAVVVDDNIFDRILTRRAIKRIDPEIEVIEIASAAHARDFLNTARPEFITLDQRLGDGFGVDLAKELAEYPHLALTPMIMISGEDCVMLADHVAETPCCLLLSKDELLTTALHKLLLSSGVLGDAASLEKPTVFAEHPASPFQDQAALGRRSSRGSH